MNHAAKFRIGIAAATLIAVALSGCTASPSPAPAKSHATTVKTTPKPSATADPYAAPKPRIPLPCSRLVDPAIVSSVPAKLTLHTATARTPLQAVLQQAGYLHCDWDTSAAPPSSGIELSVIVGEKQAAQADIARRLKSGATSLNAGDQSASTCYVSAALQCQASVLDGRYWLSFGTFGTPSDLARPATVTTELALMYKVAKSTIAQLLDAGPPGPAWTPPSTIWSPATSCSALFATAHLAAALKTPSLKSSDGGNLPGDIDPIWQYVTEHSDYYNCMWESSVISVPPGQVPGLALRIIPGAGWSWPQLATAPNVTSIPIPVAGAQSAFYRCDTVQKDCWADALSDHSWLHAYITSTDATKVKQNLTVALAAIIAGKQSQAQG